MLDPDPRTAPDDETLPGDDDRSATTPAEGSDDLPPELPGSPRG